MGIIDKQGFMEYLAKTFNGFENCFLRETISNIIEYGIKEKSVAKNQLVYFLDDMIPEIEIKEIVPFVSDNYLTNDFQKIKYYNE